MPTGVEEEEEEVPPKERTIVTALKSKVQVEGVYETIEWTVQHRARVESIGSSLYTLVLTDLLDRGVELAEPHLSQGFINACFRACCATHPGGQPPTATYGACPRLCCEKKWRAANTDESLSAAGFQGLLDAAAQQHTLARTATIASYRKIESSLRREQAALVAAAPAGFVWPAWGGRTCTVNAAARRYKVVLDNALWMTIESRQKKVLRLEITALLEHLWRGVTTRAIQKRIEYFLLTKVTREINGLDPVPHAMYKLQEATDEGLRMYDEAGLDALVAMHQDELPPPGGEEKDVRTQWPLELQTKKEPHRYVAYHRHLWLRLSAIRNRISTADPEAKLPSLFTIVPQLKPKARCMDFGTDQVVELLARLSEQQDVNLPLPATEKKRTLVQWKQLVATGEAWTTLFRGIPCHFTGTLTTDGVRAHWHVGQSKADKKAMVARNRAVRATNKRKRRTDAVVPRGKKQEEGDAPDQAQGPCTDRGTSVETGCQAPWTAWTRCPGRTGRGRQGQLRVRGSRTRYLDPCDPTARKPGRCSGRASRSVHQATPGPAETTRPCTEEPERVRADQPALEARDQEGLGQDQAVETGRPPQPTTCRGSTGRYVSQQQHAPCGVLAVHKGETGNDGGLRRGVPTSSSPTVETGDVPG